MFCFQLFRFSISYQWIYIISNSYAPFFASLFRIYDLSIPTFVFPDRSRVLWLRNPDFCCVEIGCNFAKSIVQCSGSEWGARFDNLTWDCFGWFFFFRCSISVVLYGFEFPACGHPFLYSIFGFTNCRFAFLYYVQIPQGLSGSERPNIALCNLAAFQTKCIMPSCCGWAGGRFKTPIWIICCRCCIVKCSFFVSCLWKHFSAHKNNHVTSQEALTTECWKRAKCTFAILPTTLAVCDAARLTFQGA